MSLGIGHQRNIPLREKVPSLINLFSNYAAPLTPALPPTGAGAYAMLSVLPEREQICVQVIQHYRNRGMPQRRGRRQGLPET